jgi:hypothetical protein
MSGRRQSPPATPRAPLLLFYHRDVALDFAVVWNLSGLFLRLDWLNFAAQRQNMYNTRMSPAQIAQGAVLFAYYYYSLRVARLSIGRSPGNSSPGPLVL